MNESRTTIKASGGLGFCGALAILFIGLRLAGVIAWSWWWVLAPLWMPPALAFAAVILVLLGCLAAMAVAAVTGGVKEA